MLFAPALWLTSYVTIALQPAEVPGDQEAGRINTQLAAVHLDMRDLELANTMLAYVLPQDPGLAAAHWTNPPLKVHLRRPELAAQHFRAALELDPRGMHAHNNFGVFLCSISRVGEVQAQFEQALYNLLYDQPEKAVTNAGVFALKGRDVVNAEKYFVRALHENSELAPRLVRDVPTRAWPSQLLADPEISQPYLATG